MYKIAKIVAIILGVIGLVLWVIIARADSDVVAQTGSSSNNVVGMMISLGYWATIIVAIVTLLFSLAGIASEPQKLKKALISVGVFAAVVLVSYLIGTSEGFDFDKMADKGIAVTASTVKWVDAGLWSFYILAFMAVVAMIVGGFKKQ
ncbi:hypothetical protein I215_11030 [Galbibacter marinus]|uniref:Uncharacterized protein n=1 Tax=Galbibacter marinus TaxID=555500 RepID=K2Q1K4_9FLAO|nr:hypothetical protein [Galbibacter marinus]EKF54716.1 hypothetical protein I215_11030 [Galbibacter marinus]